MFLQSKPYWLPKTLLSPGPNFAVASSEGSLGFLPQGLLTATSAFAASHPLILLRPQLAAGRRNVTELTRSILGRRMGGGKC